MLKRTRSKALSLSFLFFAVWLGSPVSVFSQATVFILRNGDRLTGRVVSENLNQVVISNGWTTNLSVPLQEISRREILTMKDVVSTATPVQTNVSIAAPIPGTNAPTKVVTNTSALASTPKPKGPQHWHGEVQVGTDLGFSEKDRQLYYGRFKLTYGRELRPQRFFKNTFDFNSTYGRTDGITSANQANGSSKTDFDLTKRVFVYNLMGAGYDEIRKIDFQYEVGPGFGYHILALTNFVLNSELGMSYQAQYLNNQKTLERYFFRFAQDLKWVISSKLNFDEKFEFMPRDDFEQYRFRIESNLRYTFFEKFIFTLTFLDTYDTQPAKEVSPNDMQIRSSLGLKF